MNKIFLLLFMILLSCTDDEFTKTNTGESSSVDPVKVKFEEKCSNFAPPPVDILLVVDNSGSVNFLEVDLKQAVSKIISRVSEFYDYRIYVVPLIASESTIEKRSYQVVTSTPQDVPISAKVVGVNQLQMPPIYNFQTEKGFFRVSDLIKWNSRLSDLCHVYGWDLNHRGVHPSDGKMLCLDASCGANGKTCTGSTNIQHGGNNYRAQLVNNSYYRVWIDGVDNSYLKNNYIFRKGSHLLAILLSNGDDNDFSYDYQGNPTIDNFHARKNELLNIRNSLQSTQFRFLSAVNHTSCGTTVREPGDRYRAMSEQILSAQGISGAGVSTPDSYNLCSNNLESIFNAIAEAIDKFKIGHIYNYWPLGPELDFDPSKLVVRKKVSKQVLTKGDSVNGYTFMPNPQSDLNIREVPPVSQLNPAERYSGYFIQLHGGAKVNYPECLIVRKEEYTKYYGYVVVDREPDPSTIKLTIEGNEIPQSDSNGWTYIGFKESINVLVNVPDGTPGDFRTGYVLKLHGNAIFGNDKAKDVEVIYKVAPF